MTGVALTRRIPAVAFVAAVTCLPACSRSEGLSVRDAHDSAHTRAPAPAPRASRRAPARESHRSGQRETFSSWTRELVAQGYGLATPAGFQGPRVNAHGHPVHNEFRLALSDDVQSGATADATAKKKVKQKRELYRVVFENGPLSSHMALAVDRRVPWRRVVDVVDYAASAGFVDIDWAFPVRSELAEPAPSKREAVRVNANLAGGSFLYVGRCWINLDVAVSDLAGVQNLAQYAGKLLAQRACHADTDRLREVFWVMLERDKGGPMTTFHTKIARAGATIEAPPDRRFGDMVSTIVQASAHGGAVTLDVQ